MALGEDWDVAIGPPRALAGETNGGAGRGRAAGKCLVGAGARVSAGKIARVFVHRVLVGARNFWNF